MGESPVRGGAVWVLCVGVSLIDREWLRCWVGCVGCEEKWCFRFHSFIHSFIGCAAAACCLLEGDLGECFLFLCFRWRGSIPLAYRTLVRESTVEPRAETSAEDGYCNTQVSIDRKYDVPCF